MKCSPQISPQLQPQRPECRKVPSAAAVFTHLRYPCNVTGLEYTWLCVALGSPTGLSPLTQQQARGPLSVETLLGQHWCVALPRDCHLSHRA